MIIFFKTILFLLLLINVNYNFAALPQKNVPIAYYAINTQIEVLKENNDKTSQPLPDNLIIVPGNYSVNEKSYRIDKEGLYRFYLVSNNQDNYQQRIVYDKNIHALLSALSLMSIHGTKDNSLSITQLRKQLLHRKISVTCSVVSRLAYTILNENGITSRMISTNTLDDWNYYDNGHVVLEVLINNKWVLYDLDLKNTFIKNGEPLNLLDILFFPENVTYDLVKIGLPAFEFSDDKSLDFFYDKLYADNKKWYKRIFQMFYLGDNYICENTFEKRERAEQLANGSTFLDVKNFKEKYYTSS